MWKHATQPIVQITISHIGLNMFKNYPKMKYDWQSKFLRKMHTQNMFLSKSLGIVLCWMGPQKTLDKLSNNTIFRIRCKSSKRAAHYPIQLQTPHRKIISSLLPLLVSRSLLVCICKRPKIVQNISWKVWIHSSVTETSEIPQWDGRLNIPLWPAQKRKWQFLECAAI